MGTSRKVSASSLIQGDETEDSCPWPRAHVQGTPAQPIMPRAQEGPPAARLSLRATRCGLLTVAKGTEPAAARTRDKNKRSKTQADCRLRFAPYFPRRSDISIWLKIAPRAGTVQETGPWTGNVEGGGPGGGRRAGVARV